MPLIHRDTGGCALPERTYGNTVVAERGPGIGTVAGALEAGDEIRV
ncbi:MAG TPA: hypothetical protein PLV96_01635 [Methanoregulaceae archaeon]|nr:hypothetical protein [Methanoregulaceae archaeon]